MIAKVARFFQRRDPHREATLALARITTLSDLSSLPWDSGIYDDRRSRDEVHAALGVWVTPIPAGESADSASMRDALQAVCCDLRAEGFGVLTPVEFSGDQFLVTIPNGGETEESWKYFVATCCHQTAQPGGWHRVGLRVEQVHDPTPTQMRELRDLMAVEPV